MRPHRALVLASLFLAYGAPPPDAAASPDAPGAPPLEPVGTARLSAAAESSPVAAARLRGMEAGGTSGWDTAYVAFDASGARTVFVSSFSPGDWSSRYLERRSADGALRWTLGWAGESEFGGVNADGEVFIAHLDRAAWLWSIAKLGANGRLLWNASLGSADWSARVFPLGDGGAIVVMEGARQLGAERFVVRRLDVDGRESAPRVLLCPSDCTTLSDVALASDGDLLLVRDGTLVKLALDSTERWSLELSEPWVGWRLAGGPEGGIFAYADLDDSLVSVAADGRVRFRRPVLDDEAADVWGAHLAVDAAGRIGMATFVWTPDAGNLVWVHLLDPDGNVLWASWHRDLSGMVKLWVASVAFDPAGRLAVAGRFEETDFLGRHHVPQGESDAFYLQFDP